MFNHSRIKRSLVVGLTAAAAAFPAAAQARFVVDGGLQSAAKPPSAVAATAQPGTSFDWGDAGIGAAGMAMLVGATALGTATTRRRRGPALN